MLNNMLSKVFNKVEKGEPELTKDAVAELLKVTPEALDEFEKAYQIHALNYESENLFDRNSRQAAEENHILDPDTLENLPDTSNLVQRIVDELLAQTKVYRFDGNTAQIENLPALPAGTPPVELKEIEKLPANVQPQLTGNLIKRDIPKDSYPAILWFYSEYLEAKDKKKRKFMYDHFRQGLDLLDLDSIVYQIIDTNRTSMGHWLPQLVEACRSQSYFKIPKTTIAKVPITLLQLTRVEYSTLTPTTLAILDQWAYQTFKLNTSQDYFIKTGTYSSKFDFRNAHVTGPKEVKELGEYLLFIHFQAVQMAGPLCTPTIYGVSTTTEWVVREWIPDKEGNPCIYKGLPLHTEYRIFIDCNTKEVLGYTPYWEPKTMKDRFTKHNDANSPHNIHDYVIYKAHEDKLMERYNQNINNVVKHVEQILPYLNLQGQWSLDIMQNGDDFWLIDMAVAENSTFYKECVPAAKRAPIEENWLPELPGAASEDKPEEQ